MNSDRDISINDFERIEAYLLGTMDAVDRNQFEKERQNNPDFDKIVSEHSELLRAVEIGALREQLAKIHLSQVAKRPSISRFWFAVAAGMALLVVSVIWWQMQPNQYGKLFATHVSVDPGLPVPMSASVNGMYKFYDAMVDYKVENYDLAFSKWSNLLETKPNNDTIQFYIGMALFNQEAFLESLPYFTKVEKNSESVFQYKSQWYKLLVALAQENNTDILALEPLPNSPYTNQINAIQAELKQ